MLPGGQTPRNSSFVNTQAYISYVEHFENLLRHSRAIFTTPSKLVYLQAPVSFCNISHLFNHGNFSVGRNNGLQRGLVNFAWTCWIT